MVFPRKFKGLKNRQFYFGSNKNIVISPVPLIPVRYHMGYKYKNKIIYISEPKVEEKHQPKRKR